MEKRIKTSASLAEMLNDCSIDRVSAIDNQWHIIAWNNTAECITGLKKETLLHRSLLEVFPEVALDAELLAAIRTAMQGITSFVGAKAGAFNRHHYENHFIPLKDSKGHVMGVMNIMHDVAHRVKAERKLEALNIKLTEQYRQLEKANNELVTFTGITGNELKNPIRKLYTSLELIMRTDGPQLSDSSKAALRRMQSSVSSMNFLLDDILALSKASSLSFDFAMVNLNTVLEDALVLLRDKISEKQARIEPDKLPVITGSKKMLEYLFVNLIDNALKFQPENHVPEIKISVEYLNTGSQADEGAEKNYVCLHFKDNGIGFPESEADKAFTMFERLHSRRKYPGSGIGLTISRKIAEAHGGFIEARSRPGQGATFTCCLAMHQVI